MGEVRQSRMAQSIERFFVGSEPRLEDVLRPIGRFQSDGTVIPFTPAELESLLPKVGIASRTRTGEMLLWDAEQSLTTETLTAARFNQQPYHPRAMQALLEERFGAENVTAHTLVSFGKKNSSLGYGGFSHLQTGVPFDIRAFPAFDKHVIFETTLSQEITSVHARAFHMREATRHLRELIQKEEFNIQTFTQEQLQAIIRGSDKIPHFTWHHHQELGRMQLVPEKIHNVTPHVGGMSTWRPIQ